MTNINVRVVGTANVSQMEAAFGQLQAQVAALNKQLASMVALQNGVDPTGYNNMARAAAANDRAFRSAVASTGMFEQAQLRVNRATDDYIDQLKRQKLSFRELVKQRKIAAAAYKEQLAMEQMMVRQSAQATARGRQVIDVMYPNQVSKDLDTASRRLAFFNEQLKSGAHQMVNWGKNTQWAGRQLMVGFTMPIMAAGAAAGVLAYQMDKEFTRIAKVYDTTADASSNSLKDVMAVEKELKKLREDGTATAIKAAQEYGVAAKDTLNVQAELAATGQRGADLQKGTAEVMRIARLGELDYQTATQATIALQTVFRMSTDELTESFNYMNSIENATSLTTQDFATAIPIASGTVREFGGDVKELGILLTAMKSRGIEASQAANGLKATMQRLGRPSKQIQKEFKEITGTDLKALVDTSGSLTEIFTRIRAVTKDLKASERRDVFAGVFGSYQVKQMMALVDGMEDIEKGYGQTAVAAEIAKGSADDWAETANREMERYQKSISGRWDTALQEMKIQLSTLGEPFVEVATQVLKGISWIIKSFNSMPKAAKIAVALGIALAAIAGPVVMLTGLFANLFGNLLKTGAAITGLVAKMNLGTTAQRAAALHARMATAGFISERTAVQQLTLEIEKLTLAQAAANAASTRTAMNAGMTAASLLAAQRASPYTNPSAGATPLLSTSVWGATAADSKKIQDAAEKEAKARQRSARNMKLMGASSVVAMGSMVTMMSTTNTTADNIAKWALIGSIVVPAVAQMHALLVSSNVQAALLKSNMIQTAVAARAAAAAQGAGAMGQTFAFLKNMGKVSRVGGPLAIAVAITGTIVKNQYDAAQAAKKVAAEQQKQVDHQKELLNITDRWAKASGETLKNYKAIKGVSGLMVAEEQQTLYQQDYEFYSKGDGKNAADAFAKSNATQQNAQMMLMFAEQTEKAGRSLDDVKTSMLAFAVASGDSLSEANERVNTLFNQIDKWGGKANFSKILQQQMDLMLNNLSGGESDQIIKENAKNTAEIYAAALATASEAEQREMIGTLTNSVETASKSMYGQVVTMFNNASKEDKDRLSKMFDGELTDMLSSYENFQEALDSGDIFGVLNKIIPAFKNNDWDDSVPLAEDLRTKIAETKTGIDGMNAGFIEQLRLLGLINGDVDTLAEAMRSPDLFQFASPAEQKKVIGEQLSAYQKMRQFTADLADTPILGGGIGDPDQTQAIKNMEAELLELVNTANKSQGFAVADDLDTAIANMMNEIPAAKDEIDDLKKKAKGTAGQYTLDFDINTSFRDMRMGAMKDIQEQIADSYRDALDAQQQAASDARQNYWDNQQEAQDNAFQRQQDALDAKWERKKDKATDYWDNRVKLVDKAIKAEEDAENKRQKMFDAEMARIDRLNEAMNRNIDFNVALNEGNFDEAAKIRNDANAADANTALELAAAAGSEGSKNRVDALGERKERIEEKRDQYMKRLEKREKAERRHLEKIQNMQKKALDARVKADMAALQKMQTAEQKSLDARLRLFQAYIPRNKAELKKHMNDVGLEYTKFGEGILHPKAKEWGNWYGSAMRQSMREQALALQSDAVWEKVGRGASQRILRGMGFMNSQHFEYFVRTGKMKMDDGRPYPGFIGPVQTRHEGGMVGSDGGGSRKGVARTLGGLHSSEQMVRAQKGEYIVNRRDASKNRDVLEAINSGRYGTDVGVGGAGSGMAGMVTGFLARALISGIGRSFENAATQATSAAGSYASGKAGIYGDRVFNATQLKNAATIASVGSSMGMSTRDIMIGIMTAITESGLVNVNYGDRDSLGLFQQRPSQGWGTPEQVTNPNYAARKFFEGLRGVKGRNDMAPWLAAQAVQRSFDPTGSNYKQYWDEANAILKNGLTRSGNGYTAGGFIQGAGGKHRPVRGGTLTQGLHYLNAIDFGVPRGTPVYAAADGKVVRSMDIAGPLPTDSYRGDGPYGSYGRVIEINHGGFSTLYAHLSQRYASAGQQVRGGAKIGLSGNTGNSSGPHLHFGAPGSNPYAFLKTGGTVKKDNTPALLHRDERVLTAPLTKKLDYAVDAMYNGAKYGIGGKGGRRAVPYGSFSYPGLGTGVADSPYTWMSNSNVGVSAGSSPGRSSGDSGAKTGLRIGTLNTWVKSSAKATISDLARLIPNADFLALTEMARKAASIKKWLATKGWGVVGSGAGTRSASLMAYNKATQILEESGQRKLGNKMANVIGGREIRYANYGLFKDKKSGRKTWQVAAHTVPAGRGLNAKNAPLYHEQWGNLNRLVGELQGGGTPVFVSGDLNVHKGAKNFQTPGNLDTFANKGVDYVFGDKKLTRLQRQWLVRGMHTDHGQHALMSQFSIPQLAKGAENIRWDNTIANLHRGESVLTADISAKFKQGVDNFANGGGPVYNDIKVYASEGMDEEALANKVIKKIERSNARKPQSRRGN